MNFFDTYEIARSTTPNVEQVDNNEQPTLNEEVSQVIGQLGRFWGGFRKQVWFATVANSFRGHK